jgi:hypothetical protein
MGDFMKRLSFLLVIFFFVYSSDAQYSEYIAGYNLYFNKLNEGQTMPELDQIIKQDTTLTFAWERGDSTTGGYVSPYASTLYTLVWVENTLELWNGDTTSSLQSISFINGMYELTVTEVDTLQNQSPYSDPLFIEFRGVFARIPINLQIMK